jgi:DNA mismatch repair ATPase MutS
MKAYLMHRDCDFDIGRDLPNNHEALTQDLELDTLLGAMSAGDRLLYEVSERALLGSLQDPEDIVYRQEILADCMAHPSIVRELYALAGEALAAEKSVWGGMYRASPRSLLTTSVKKMELLVGFLRRLREMTDAHAGDFSSPGFKRFFTMLAAELDERYFELVESQLRDLNFKSGMLLSAQLAAGNKGADYVLRRPRQRNWFGRMFDRSAYSFTLPERDENGLRALNRIEDEGANLAANALTQSVDHVHSFFLMLRIEVGFYVACLNLRTQVASSGEPPATFPTAVSEDATALAAEGLCDVSLVLSVASAVVGNDIAADEKSLVMITGANQGGKSTFLRGLGLAQLMMQAGMFVTAASFRANICDGLFTHFKREEDETLESGKLDEELARMSDIADHITSHSMLLCNESFASTNEREGSAIARQIIRALIAEGVKLVVVTHMFELASGFHRDALDHALFLRAERGRNGARPFRLIEGEPLPTSYGHDSYQKVFGGGLSAALSEPDGMLRTER